MIHKIVIIFLMASFSCVAAAYTQDLGQLKNQKPVTIHGGISAGANYYTSIGKKDSASKISYGQSPSYFFQANPVFSIYGFNIPVHVLLASQSSSIGTSVFNRFGISPNYKWAKLHLGWRSLNFSQFTLAGQQMLGAGFELTPGKFRVAFMYGKFNDAITNISSYNNLNNNAPLFKRKGFAAKVGYGSEKNFIEFSYLQAKDDSNSLHGVILDTLLVKPAANQVAGLKGKLTLMHHVSIETDAAVSYYTRDITEQFLNLDASLKSLTVIKPRTTSQLAVAGETKVRYTFRSGSVIAGYRRVDPDYHSMGAFYMQTDLEQYTAGLNLSFWKHKINLQSKFGLQKNNLSHTAVNNSSRTIGSANISINPSQKFGIDFQYSNYGISQQIIPQLQNPATIVRYDSVRISQVNQSFSISPHVFLSGKSLQHSINVQTSFQSLNNFNEKQSGGEFSSGSASFIYALLIPKKKINITNVFNYFNTKITDSKTEMMGYNLGVSKILNPPTEKVKPFISSITLSLNGGYYMNHLNGTSTGNTLMVNPSVAFTFLKRNTLRLIANYTNGDGNNISGNNQNLMLAARYNLSF